MAQIHPSSVVEDGATLADDVVVGPLCVVGPKVTLGPGTRLVGHATILGRTTLGAHNTVWPYATVGGEPQDLKYQGEDSQLILGDHNIIRENVTIHRGTANGGGVTRIGNHNLLMVGCHIAHDCRLADHVIVANAAQFAGHVHIENHATVAGGAGLHHFVTVGQYAYIGGLTRIVQDAPPFMLTEGNPSRVRKVNTTLLERCHFDPAQINRLKKAYRLLYLGANNNGESGKRVGRTTEAIKRLETDFPDDDCIQALLESVRKANLGMHGRHLEAARQDNPHTNPAQ